MTERPVPIGANGFIFASGGSSPAEATPDNYTAFGYAEN